MENKALKFIFRQGNLQSMPGYQFAYWLSPKMQSLFSKEQIENHFDVKAGICTGENDRFIFLWHEINFAHTSIVKNQRTLFTPHNKGGEYKKWYGNRIYVLKYNQDSLNEMSKTKGFRHDGEDYYFRKHISWTKICSTSISFRYFEEGFTFDSAGLGMFSKDNEDYCTCLGFLNSVICKRLLDVLNPTLNITPMSVKALPFPGRSLEVEYAVKNAIGISKKDWDSFELSWDFSKHPLLGGQETMGSLISEKYTLWQKECEERIAQLKANEEAINAFFISVYDLSDELSPSVNIEDISISHANQNREIRSLLSYFVGLIMGRYSLDVDGLAYAGGKWDPSKYISYIPDRDGVSVINPEFFGDESLDTRCINLIKQIYGADTFEANISFVAEVLGTKGSPREAIANYFLNGFYQDHLKVYQKRPIYWMLDAGKKNSFKAVMYLHRYTPDTLATVRTDYVLPLLDRYSTRIDFLAKEMAAVEAGHSKLSNSEAAKARRELETLRGQFQELSEYEKKIHHLADQRIELDLDDGVKVNYAKLADVLAPIK